jgi:Arc/MetJ family transcription regulator
MRDYTTLHSDTDWSEGTWETIQHYTQTHIEVKEHERLYNITLRHRLKWRNMRDYTTLHSDTHWSEGTWETMQHYTQTQIEVKEQLVVRKNMDVTKHERVYNITLRHRLKWRNMRDYTTLHSDTDWSKGTTCSKKEYGCD